MSFAARAVISLLAGIGAGLLGFWAVWTAVVGSLWDSLPGPDYSNWFLAGIFIPGILVSLIAFRTMCLSNRCSQDNRIPAIS